MKHIKELKVQDNRITSEPIFVVFEKQEIHGPGDLFYNQYYINTEQDYRKISVEEFEIMEEDLRRSLVGVDNEIDGGDPFNPEDWDLGSFVEVDRFCAACFTEKGALDYIAANGHNLNKPHIFVASGYRNQEWIDIRKHLMEVAEKS